GWQTAAFVSTEIREPRKNLPRGLILGVFGVVALYLLVSEACLAVLGPAGLAATEAPASEVMKATLGPLGGRLIAAGIAISTLGFLSQSMLTAPRVYFAMARDGLFPRLLAGVHPRTRVPVAAIALQGLCAAGIAVSGRYEQILSYVVSVDWVFFALAAGSLFALRRRDREAGTAEAPFVRSGHPLTTWLFLLVCVAVVANTVYKAPRESAVGLGILLAGVPVYLAWSSRRAASPPPSP
nr:amino acid permease [Thermoanaerobaculia bacterium]